MMHAHDTASSALEGLIARFGGLLRQVGRRRGLTDAEAGELCQEVRIRMWHALTSGERIAEAPASYVYRTAMSAALDMVRRRRARREEPLEEWRDRSDPVFAGVAVAPLCEGSLEREELARQVASVVSDLAEPRDVVVRTYLAGYNHREIAELLGWTEAKVRNLLYRGLADLRAKLTALGIGPEGGPRDRP
jgi:RNA polymerase sigma factor (sigma-70 family)